MSKRLTKTQLIRQLSEKAGSDRKTAAAFLKQLSEIAIKQTKKEGVFVLHGLGRLVKSNRKARMGRNPQTGEPIKISAKAVVKFRLAKPVKDAISPRRGGDDGPPLK